jgi:hypothetical protein
MVDDGNSNSASPSMERLWTLPRPRTPGRSGDDPAGGDLGGRVRAVARRGTVPRAAGLVPDGEWYTATGHGDPKYVEAATAMTVLISGFLPGGSTAGVPVVEWRPSAAGGVQHARLECGSRADNPEVEHAPAA